MVFMENELSHVLTWLPSSPTPHVKVSRIFSCFKVSDWTGLQFVLEDLLVFVLDWSSVPLSAGVAISCHLKQFAQRPRLFAELPIPLWQLRLCFQRLLLVLDLLDPLQKRAQQFLGAMKKILKKSQWHLFFETLSSPPFTGTQWLLCQALHLEDANGIHSIPNLASVKALSISEKHQILHWLLLLRHSWWNSV